MLLGNTIRRALAALSLCLSLTACGPSNDWPAPPTIDAAVHSDPLIVNAVIRATEAVERDPGAFAPRVELGKFFAASDLHSQARTSFEQAIELGANDARTLSFLAFECQHLGDVQSALTRIREAQALRADHAPLFWWEGYWLLGDGQPEQAEAAFQKATDVNAKDLQGWLGLARARLQTGEAESALEALATLRASAKGRMLTHASHLTGTALARLGRDDEAAPYFEAGDPVDFGRVDRWRKELLPYGVGLQSQMNLARRALRARKTEQAIDILEPLLEHHSSTRGLVDNLASCYLTARRFQDTIDVLAKHVDESAPSANSYYLEACAREVLGAKSDVVNGLLAKSLETGPRFLPTLVRLAQEAVAAGEFEQALEHLEIVAGTVNPSSDMLALGGRCAAELERWDRAVALNEKALRLAPSDPVIGAALQRAREQLESAQ